MPLPAQAKILRVLQDKAITRVGGDKMIPADVRVIAATNRNLTELIAEGKFREDLYYRLRVIDIPAPALRERREDIPLLVEYFLDRHNRRYRQKKQFNREAMRRILDYPWPGNIRELENAIPLRSERIFSPGASGGMVPSAQTSATDTGAIPIPPEGLDLDTRRRDLEKAAFEEAIRRKDGNREAASRLLGIKPHTFRKRAKEKFGL